MLLQRRDEREDVNPLGLVPMTHHDGRRAAKSREEPTVARAAAGHRERNRRRVPDHAIEINRRSGRSRWVKSLIDQKAAYGDQAYQSEDEEGEKCGKNRREVR